jgi:hypothetical protein
VCGTFPNLIIAFELSTTNINTFRHQVLIIFTFIYLSTGQWSLRRKEIFASNTIVQWSYKSLSEFCYFVGKSRSCFAYTSLVRQDTLSSFLFQGVFHEVNCKCMLFFQGRWRVRSSAGLLECIYVGSWSLQGASQVSILYRHRSLVDAVQYLLNIYVISIDYVAVFTNSPVTKKRLTRWTISSPSFQCT